MLDKNRKPDADQPVFALGRQLTLEYYECGPDALLEKEKVEHILLTAARNSGATVISSSFHQFDPQGVSGVVIIAESHFTVHAWPEHNYAAVDIFTCGDNINLDRAIHAMQEGFASRRVLVSSDRNRGLLNPGDKNANQAGGQHLKDRNTLPISWKKTYGNTNPWGVLTSVDLYQCNPEDIRKESYIKDFMAHLCDKIHMKPFGDCQVVPFREDGKIKGYSMIQMIETALIFGHFTTASNTAYLDILSCKFYEPRDVAEFCCVFLKADNYKMQIALRK